MNNINKLLTPKKQKYVIRLTDDLPFPRFQAFLGGDEIAFDEVPLRIVNWGHFVKENSEFYRASYGTIDTYLSVLNGKTNFDDVVVTSIKLFGKKQKAIEIYITFQPPKYSHNPLPKITFPTYDACHHGFGDFYPIPRSMLIDAIKAKTPFTTGWYSCKKEIGSARIARHINGVVEINVSVSDDNDIDGHGTVVLTKKQASIKKIMKSIYEAWDDAEENLKENQSFGVDL